MQQLTTGTLLQGGKYKIERVLGQGGFGITYLAEQVMLGREVAIKEFFMKELCDRDGTTNHITLGTSGSTEIVNRFREKFLKEARIIACFSNTHIVHIYDIFEENGTAYYVMENLDGGSLENVVSEHALDEPQALKYIREIADALKYIHEQNILHLDIKPSNILLRKNGEAVLIDFGISKRYDEDGGQTSTTPAGISKGYAPTEQYNQGVANFSPATDIYSLGATLYKMLSGVTPPEASLLLNDDAELVRPDGISFSTWCAIERAMEPKRKKRPQKISEFLELLGHVDAPIDITKEKIQSAEETTILDEVKDETSEETVIKESNNQNVLVAEYGSGNLIFTVNGVTFKMIKVKSGSFTMGKEHFFGSLFSDNNAHKVTLTKDYYIGETAVTQELWQCIMGENPSIFQNADNPEETKNRPVEYIHRNDCQRFFSALKDITNYTFRFPTEAEWEYAAKGGIYERKKDYGEAWCADNSNNHTHDVKTLDPNSLGLYDMLGNVQEWCEDSYVPYNKDNLDPNIVIKGNDTFVVRGGSFLTDALDVQPEERNAQYSRRAEYTGLRLAMSVQ